MNFHGREGDEIKSTQASKRDRTLTNIFLNIKVESGDDHMYYVDKSSQNRLIESIFINDGFLNSFFQNGKPYHPDLAIIKLDNSFQNFHAFITVQVNPLWKSMDPDADFIRNFNPQDYAGILVCPKFLALSIWT